MLQYGMADYNNFLSQNAFGIFSQVLLPVTFVHQDGQMPIVICQLYFTNFLVVFCKNLNLVSKKMFYFN